VNLIKGIRWPCLLAIWYLPAAPDGLGAIWSECLSRADQIELYGVIRDYLGADIGRVSESDDQIDRRREALVASL